MSYVKITDLPELLENNIEGEEFLLVTNSNKESNKLKLNTIIEKIGFGVYTDIQNQVNDIIVTEVENKLESLTELINSANTEVIDLKIEVDNLRNEIYQYIDDSVNNILINISTQTTTLLTTSKLQIFNNKITLPKKCKGTPIFNSCLVYDTLNSVFFTEYTCSVSADGLYIIFDQFDNLNNKFAVVTYQAYDNI